VFDLVVNMHVDLDVQMVKALGKKVRRVLQLQNVVQENRKVFAFLRRKE
jgi:hypothetical protein